MAKAVGIAASSVLEIWHERASLDKQKPRMNFYDGFEARGRWKRFAKDLTEDQSFSLFGRVGNIPVSSEKAFRAMH
jgi:hypothetical protein